MKKKLLIISNLIIVFAIVAGCVAIVYRNTKTYQDLAEKYLENIVSLADINISKQIENSMTRPVTVSKTMANDEFLKEWISQEKEKSGDEAYLNELYGYLKTYQRKYDYATVFCISAETGNYYYQDGFNKTLSAGDEHDIWYYNFIHSGKEYDLEVDTNEANNDSITVFVNFRVESYDGRLLGVIGVGLQVSSIEEMIHSYRQDYDLSVFIINVGGAQTSFTGETDIFIKAETLAERTGVEDNIELNKSDRSRIQWFTNGGQRKCLITTYDESLGWFLIVEKETDAITRTFQAGIKNNIIFMLISLSLCVTITTVIFLNYNRRMLVLENTDELTGLSNKRLFSRQYPVFVRRHREHANTLFMFDIDNFKEINDTYGHIFGNAILAMVGQSLQKTVEGLGIASRWGGDEFLGLLSVGPKEAERILAGFMEELKKEEDNIRCRITVSVGLAEIDERLHAEKMIKKADQAMYRSKQEGRDRTTVYSESEG